MQPVDHLVAAALVGDDAVVRALLRDDPTLVDQRNMFGVGAAHAAHFGGHHRLAGQLTGTTGFVAAELGLLDRMDVDPRTFDDRGSTALHGAAYWGQLEAAEVLIERGADVNAVSRDAFLRITPLGSAVATTPGVPQPSDDEDTVLALVRLLLEHGAEVNARRQDGMTALHTAAWRGFGHVVQELLDAGADPTITATAGPHQGEAAADTALGQGHLVLGCRLDAGVEVATGY